MSDIKEKKLKVLKKPTILVASLIGDRSTDLIRIIFKKEPIEENTNFVQCKQGPHFQKFVLQDVITLFKSIYFESFSHKDLIEDLNELLVKKQECIDCIWYIVEDSEFFDFEYARNALKDTHCLFIVHNYDNNSFEFNEGLEMLLQSTCKLNNNILDDLLPNEVQDVYRDSYKRR